MKKIFICFLLLFLAITNTSQAREQWKVEEFTKELQGYRSEFLPELQEKDWLPKVMAGKMELSGQAILQRIGELFLKEFQENKALLLRMIAIALLCTVLKHLQLHFGGNVSEIAFFSCYLLILLMIITSFSNMASVCLKSIASLKNFMNLLIPVLITLLLTLGNVATVATIQPCILTMISIISTVVSQLLIPLIVMCTILNLVSNLSEEMKVDKVSQFIKKTGMYLVEFLMIVFARFAFFRRNFDGRSGWCNCQNIESICYQ